MSFFDSRFVNLCDAELVSDDGITFRVHRVILAMKCEYFCSMFCGTNEGKRQFKILGISGNCLREILKYIYTGDVLDTAQQALDLASLLDLLLAAEQFGLQDMYLQIREHLTKEVAGMKLTITNCLTLLNTAININDGRITRRSYRFVEAKFEEIVHTQMNDLAQLPLEVVEKILGSRSLKVSSESTVWRWIVQWTSKDIASRSKCVPQLLMFLVRNELNEILAKEILEHEIVSENSFMKDLNALKYSPDFTSSLDALLYYLENNSNSFKQPLPEKLNVIAYEDEDFTYSLYITYDENIDLWRQIGENSKRCFFYMTIVTHNVYLFGLDNCAKFDLISQQWMPISTFPNKWKCLSCHRSVFQIDGFIYIIAQCRKQLHVVIKVYDTLRDKWFDGVSLTNLKEAKSVTFNKQIYVVGEEKKSWKMTTLVFDTRNKKWEILSPPRIHRRLFSLIVHCEKVYSLGGHDCNTLKTAMNVEVFDPKTNLWKDLPQLPFSSINTRAVVFDDLIIAYDNVNPSKAFVWNGVCNQWKQFGSSSPKFNRFLFGTITDDETIRSVMKVYQDPGKIWQKSPFDC